MKKDFVKRAKDIIEKILYITIASVTPEGEAWNSPVYSAYDKENYTFYFVSPTATQHVVNITKHPAIFIVIYDSTVPEGTGEGVYMQARTEELKDEAELKRAIELLYLRKNKPLRELSKFTGDAPRRIFKAVPKKVWMNDTEEVNGIWLDKRVEIDLRK